MESDRGIERVSRMGLRASLVDKKWRLSKDIARTMRLDWICSGSERDERKREETAYSEVAARATLLPLDPGLAGRKKQQFQNATLFKGGTTHTTGLRGRRKACCVFASLRLLTCVCTHSR